MALNNINDLVPLTTNQREIWLEQELFPCSPIYNIGGYVEIKASVDYDVFSRAVKYVVEENDSLQIVLEKHEGIAHQRFVQPDGVDLHVKDFSDDEDPYSRCLTWMRKEFEKPFNLHGDHLFHFTLIKVSSELYVWFSKFHHIVIDGWSISSVVTRVGEFYTELKTNSSFQVAPGSSYKEYALQNGEYFKSGQYTKAQEYWTKTLSDAPDSLLPRFRHTVENVNQINSHKNMSLPLDFYNRITDEAASKGFSAFQFVLGAFYSYFSRIYGKEDIVFGIPVLNRRNNTEKNTVGLFVGVIPLRIQAEPDVIFLELLEIIKRKIRESFRYQHLPLSEINLCNKSRHGNEGKIFDILFSFEKIDFYSSFDGVEGLFTPMTLDREPLVIAFKDYAGRDPFLEFSYNKNYFKEFVVDRMMCHIEKVLQETFETPDIEVRKIDYIPEEEKQRIIYEFNNTKTSYPKEKTISQLFEEQVERAPDNTALVFENKKLSYRQLNEQANRFAHCLREHYDFQPNDLVGVLLNRSEYMIISLLGIIKAGGAYVPLDPDYPGERLAFMIKDSGIRILITQSDLQTKRSSIPDHELIIVNIETVFKSHYPIVNLQSSIFKPEDLAYVMYTSGSTGTPKGVMVAHKPVVRLVKNCNYIEISSNDRILQTGSLSFDASTFEIWGALLNGAALYLVPFEDLLKTSKLGRILKDYRITTLWLTSSFFNQIVEEDEKIFSDVKHLLVGGERLSVTHINKLRSANTSLEIINGYGPTENTTFTTTYRIEQVFKTDIPIGTSISNTRVYITDKSGQLSPIGVPGELCITGDGLAMGYLNEPDITDEKFAPCPFEPGEKMYRTGDIVRLLPDRNIEFLGRADNQVKIHGYRIECGEIEQALLHHSEIQKAVVVVREEEEETKELVTYFVSNNELTTSELRSYLNRFLPEYMIPLWFVPLDHIPLTPNGKIDKKALPAPEGLQLGTGAEYIAPRNSIERQLSAIWEEVLARESISIRDNFFEIGGHSLNATQVVSRFHKVSGIELQFRDIFQYPTIESLAKVAQEKQQTLYQSIKPVEIQAHYPLSHAQKRLWLLHQIEENSIAYNMPVAFFLEGDLNCEALQKAFEDLIERHEILRTSFITVDGEPRQKVHKGKEFHIEEVDLRKERHTVSNTEELQRSAAEEAQRPFDLRCGPLLRVKLLQTSETRYLLLFTMNHVIADGWSLGILVRELSSLYESYLHDTEYPLEILPLQYKDYAAWHAGILASEGVRADREYWHKKLSGEIPVLDFPSDYPRPPMQTFHGTTYRFRIDKAMTGKLKSLSAQKGASLFMTLTALVKVLLYRYTGQEDIITGVPVAGRQHKDLDGQVGFYVNTLALRDTICGDDGFADVLDKVKATATEAYDHQVYPFDRLVEELNLRRDLSRSPLFDVMVALQNTEEVRFDLPGIKVTRCDFPSTISKFDLTINFEETEDTIRVEIEYNTDLFKSERIERMAAHFLELMNGIVSDADQKIREINILREHERLQLLETFNDTRAEYPANKTIVDLFEEQAEWTPQNIAVVFEGIKLTYKKLNEQANRVAHYLRNEYQIKPDDLVGVMLDRSEKMIVALLGILKSGGAYVPIDPEYPEERLAFMIKDSGIRVLITQSDLQTRLLSIAPSTDVPSYGAGNHQFVIVTIETVLTSHSPIVNFQSSIVNHQHLAYVIYTSGSTGQPKGCLITHQNVVRLLKNDSSCFEFHDKDVWIMAHSYSFDFSVWEMYGALLFGGTLIVPKRDDVTSTPVFLSLLRKHRVTVLNQTPSAFYQLIQEERNGDTTDLDNHLQYIIFGGEKLEPAYLKPWADRYSLDKIQLINMFGITETTIHVTYCRLSENHIYEAQVNSPIGGPLPETTVYILDEQQGVVPIGITGELYVGGSGVCREYLNREELTRENFIANPFKTGERLYRTGDLGRRLSDGNIEYVGRRDDQVKIRGYRIECGEVEQTLLEHPAIEGAVVIARTIKEEAKELVGYVVTRDTFMVSELRSYLSRYLPEYMIPSLFIKLDQIPRMPNGKIDKRSLPAPEGMGLETGVEYEAPRDEIERQLTAIWEEVLWKEKIGIRDNFFEIGGHSLKATQVVSRFHQVSDKELHLREIFHNPTIAELSEVIKGKQKTIYQSIPPVGKQTHYALSHAQRRLWILHNMEDGSITYNMSGAFMLEGNLDRQALQKAFDTMIERHEILRTGFVVEGGEPIQVVQKQISFQVDQIKEIDFIKNVNTTDVGEYLQECTEKEARTPFDLKKAPLLRVKLLRISETKSLLLITMHHIIGDEWSVGVFFRELDVLYGAYTQNRENPLKNLKIQYKDYASWQNKLLTSEAVCPHRDYWHEKLSGEIPVLRMPLDFPRPPVQTSHGALHQVQIDGQLSRELKSLSTGQDVSLFMSLSALVKVLLYRYTGQEEIIVGSPVAGRQHKDLEGQIGFYVNTLALRDIIRGEDRFTEVLRKVKETATEAYDHQIYPFDRLVEELGLRRDLSRSPLFDVMVVLKNKEETELKLSDIKVAPFEHPLTISKFDLVWYFMDTENGIQLSIEYNTDLFMADSIKRMVSHFQGLLRCILSDVDQRIHEINLLGEDEKNILLELFNDTKADYPKDKTIGELFEEQVSRTPHHVAVVFEERKLTYKELNEQANQIAHYLRNEYQIRPDDLVGVMLDRSEEMIVALLGILKSGGAYVPIDPEYPTTRIQYMLEDSGCKALITDSKYMDIIGDEERVSPFIDLNSLPQTSIENPEPLSSPRNLAYVIYTSGSTGKPKGAMIEHRSLINLCYWHKTEFSLSHDDRVTQFVSFSFDVSVWETFPVLVSGSSLYIVPENTKLYLKKFNIFLEKNRINLSFVPTSLCEQFFTLDNKSLRIMLTGGENLKCYTERNYRLSNNYGPTENTVVTSTCFITDISSITIGKSISNTNIYILDNQNNLLPVGVQGEICISGDGLARGYRNNPKLTAEKFIPNPFHEGERLYKTGDLGKRLPDGNIAFLGRRDEQVKIRGYRVELGEIEAALKEHPAVRENTVIVLEVSETDKRLAAYLVPHQGQTIDRMELRDFLTKRIPGYMIPSSFVMLDAMPLTHHGKIDRRALPESEDGLRDSETDYAVPQTEAEQRIAQVWQQTLQMKKVGIYDNFFEAGGNSLLLIQVLGKLQEIFGNQLSTVEMFQYPTIHALAKHLTQDKTRKTLPVLKTPEVSGTRDIAIIGMSGRFPGAKDVDTFWQNICDGVESITFFSDEELLAEGIDPALVHNPDYVKANGVLDDIEYFDADFFGYTPREAEILAPQQRLFLECAWEAMENAGYDVDRIEGRVGVFAGAGMNAYLLNNILPRRDLMESIGEHQLTISNKDDFLPTRISYKLNLKGPSVNVQTACSTSLVAVHMACKSILNGECDMVLTGGITVAIPQKRGYLYQQDMVVSSDGHCRAFDATAQGIVTGSGVGILVLKRYDQALADGDCIHAVIKASAINNDGGAKVGYTAPGVDGQSAVVAEAMRNIDAETISYIEAHGTGTAMGDPIEIAALTQAYRAHTQKKQYCAIGSVKTNVGHLDAAAGVTGVIKTALALKHRKLPPSLHFENPNPKIDFANSPFFVNTKLSEWKSDSTPRRAGVSSFGIGGTNAHVILEEAPSQIAAAPSRPWQHILLSAKTESSLEKMTGNLIAHLRENPSLNLADVAYTLHVGRKSFSHRRFVVCRNVDDAISVLESMDSKRILTHCIEPENRSVTFMFPGLGEQYVNMSRGIYDSEPTFREDIDKCLEFLDQQLGIDLKEILYREGEDEEVSSLQQPRFDLKKMLNREPEDADEASQRLNQTKFSHPAVFVIEYALAKLWIRWGITPRAMIGYSLGEYVAACLAGVLSLEDTLRILVKRAELIERLPKGIMLAVPLPENELKDILGDELSLAVVNAPSLCVAAGPEEAVITLEESLNKRDILSRRIRTSHAFHSKMMEPMKEEFANYLKDMSFSPPEIPYISNVTGTWITDEEATDPFYWAEHTCRTVHFSKGVGLLLENSETTLLEVGPGQSLTGFAIQHPNNGKAMNGHVFPSLRNRNENLPDELFLLNTIGRLWLGGVEIDHTALYAGEQRSRVPLPTYPFERRKFWIEPRLDTDRISSDANDEKVMPRTEMRDWFHVPGWKQSVLSQVEWNRNLKWMIFIDGSGLGRSLLDLLRRKNQEVVIVKRGELFSNDEEGIYTLSPGQPEEYCRLISELNESGKLPDKIVHLWSLDSYDREQDSESGFKSHPGSLDSRFYSLIFLARAIGKEGIQTLLNLGIVTNNMQSVTSDETVLPEADTTLGPCKIIPQEYKNIVCSSIDFAIPDQDETDYELIIEHITTEFLSNLPDQVVAYRGFRRWVQTFEKIRLEGHKASRVERDIPEKTERESLSDPVNARPDLGTTYKPPENEIEKKIVEMWQSLLGIEKIGIYDNFFQLGGHSLLGIRLLSRLQEAFQVDIPLKTLFDAPTVIELTRLIEEMFLMEIEGLSEEEISEQVSDIQQEQEKVSDIDTAQSYELPNKMVIRHLNKAETDHFYKDIFEDNVYYKHGIKINEGDIVFDVGANIGLFTLFAHDKCKDATIYSFEPAPPLFEILKANVTSYGVKGTLFNCGLSNKPGETSFVFYPRTAGMSSFYADKKEEMDVLTAIMENQRRMGIEGMDQVLEYAGELLTERFKEKEYVCQLRRLSDIIKEYKIDSISLLKIDVQKSELDVIEGINERDWNRIRQVVIEVHDIDGRVDHIRSILSDKGYKVYVEQDELYKGSIIFNIYGIRNDGVR